MRTGSGGLVQLEDPSSSSAQSGATVLFRRCELAGYLFGIFNRPGVAGAVLQLDGVGPVDNRPSTD